MSGVPAKLMGCDENRPHTIREGWRFLVFFGMRRRDRSRFIIHFVLYLNYNLFIHDSTIGTRNDPLLRLILIYNLGIPLSVLILLGTYLGDS